MAMPPVRGCQVTDCCYNTGEQCHALAIQVGDTATHPICDTYAGQAASQPGDRAATGHVGACKVGICERNPNLECVADSILVGHQQGEPYCLTFEPKRTSALPVSAQARVLGPG
jgi:hypothetical protein